MKRFICCVFFISFVICCFFYLFKERQHEKEMEIYYLVNDGKVDEAIAVARDINCNSYFVGVVYSYTMEYSNIYRQRHAAMDLLLNCKEENNDFKKLLSSSRKFMKENEIAYMLKNAEERKKRFFSPKNQ